MKLESTFAVITGLRRVEFDREVLDGDELEDNELLVQNLCTGISPGTELGSYAALDPAVLSGTAWNAHPWRPGYSGVGRVVAQGNRPEDLLGERVAYLAAHGSAARIRVSAQTMCAPVPEGLSDEASSMFYLACIAHSVLEPAAAGAGDTVAVFGLGQIGNIAAQFLRNAGATVWAYDPIARRRSAARACGLEAPDCESPDAFSDWVRSKTDGTGPDIVVDGVGDARVVLDAVNLVRPRGRVVMLGTPKAPLQTNLTAFLQAVHRNPVTLNSARLIATPALARENLSALVDNRIAIKPLITHTIRPEELGAAYDGLLDDKEHYLAVVICWSQ